MDLYKKQGYQVVRLGLYQFGMTLFGLVVSMATRDPENPRSPLFLCAGVFSALFYLYLVYSLVYELGQKDGIKIEAGKKEYKPLTGFWLALAANGLNILLGILSFIGKIIYDINGAMWAGQLYGVANAIAKFIQGMYVALMTLLMDVSFANLLTPIPGLIVCTVGYILGVKYCNGFGKPKKKEDRYAPKVSRPVKKD